MNRKVLGLDIRENAVTAILLKSGLKSNVVEAHGSVALESFSENHEQVKEALKEITAEMDLEGSICIAAFPADQVSYRNLRVPFKEKKKIRQMLPFELEPNLPFPVDDLIFDFHTVKFSEHTDLIAAALEKTTLESYLDTLSSVNIEPKIVTPGGYATALCLAKLSNLPEKWLFVDIDTRKCSVFASTSGQIHLIRSFPIRSATSSHAELLCANIQRTLSAYEEIFRLDFDPDLILLTGLGAEQADFRDNISKRLEIPVKLTDFIKEADASSQNQAARTWRPALMDNAYALALMETKGLAGLDFRRGPFAIRQNWEEYRKGLITAGVLAGMVLILLFMNIMLETHFLEKKLDHLNFQINDIFRSTFPEVTNIVDPLQQMRVKIDDEKKNILFDGESDETQRSIDLINEISKRIPKETDVKFGRFVLGPDTILISGDTDTFNTVDDMKGRLEQVDSFKKVTINSANMEKSGNRVNFKLKVDF